MTTTSKVHVEEESLITRLFLLIGQSFFLGLTLAFLIVAAIALLLSIYGAGALPYVYIVVAILGSIAFYGFAELQRRWTLMQVSVVTELLIAAFLILVWAGLVFAQADWLAFAAIIAFFLIIQVGFVILGGQAGRLLDVRQIKHYFPRVIAGFAVGFTVGGALVSPLQRWLGGTEYLLLAAAVSATIMLLLLVMTNVCYGDALKQAGGGGPQLPAPSLRQVLAKRFVLLIFAYQMLSAMASQLLDYMVMVAADARFADSTALAQFFGSYTFFLNLIDLLFLVLVAGFLLSRFGLRFGLAANPGVDILLLVAIVVTATVSGPTVALFFWLVIMVRVLDITFTDGTTRTSINAAYQALPGHERVTVQTGVEGIGVPLALGLTGVVLLLINAIGDVTLADIAAFTLVMSLLWLIAAFLVYRGYGANLLKTMRRRALDPAELTLDNKTGLAVTERLLTSNQLRDVRLGLDMLEGAEHPSLSKHLRDLATNETAEIQTEALTRIEALRLQEALPIVQNLVDADVDPVVHGAAIRAYCALNDVDAVETTVPYLDSSQLDVRLGAAVGLLRYGSIPGVLAVGPRLTAWEHAHEVDDRCFLARVMAEVGEAHLYQPLLSLLADPDRGVRGAALAAAGQVKHPRLLPLVINSLSDAATRSAAFEALVRFGDIMLPSVEAALSNAELSEEDAVRLVRVCGQVKGRRVLALMKPYLNHHANAVRSQVMATLHACHYQAESGELPVVNDVLRREVKHAHRLLVARQDVGSGEAVAPLGRALSDELVRARRRVFWLLSFMYESRPVLRAEAELSHGSKSGQALALEMLDVTLSSGHKVLTFPIIDPKTERDQRVQLLSRQFETDSLGRDERLLDLIAQRSHSDIQNADGQWAQPWMCACAIYAAAKLGLRAAVAAIAAAVTDRDPVVQETAVWALSFLPQDAG